MNKKKVTISVNMVVFSIIMSIIGILILIIASIKEISGPIWDAGLKNFLQALGTTLTSAGLVSILVECSTIKEITAGAIKSLVEGNLNYSNYNKDALRKMSYNIAAQRCNPPQKAKKIKDSLYKWEEKIIESMSGPYYEYHNADFVIKYDNNRFIKTASLDYVVINENNYPNIIKKSINLFTDDKNISKDECLKKFNIKKFIINKTDCTSEANNNILIETVERPKNSMYEYVVSFSKEVSSKIKRTRVQMEIEYEVPVTDLMHAYKMIYPCKQAEHNVRVEGDGWEIDGVAYAEFDCDYDNDKNNKCEITHMFKNDMKVTFNDWCMPGVGYVATCKHI